MKVTLSKSNGLERFLDVEVHQEGVRDKFNEVYEEIKKSAKIPGFRPGTAPRHLLEKHHFQLAHEEVLKRLIPETYQAALQQEKLEVISLPEITEVNLTPDSLKYKATVEIKPEISIKSYKGIKIIKKETDVKEDDMEKFLDQIKKAKKIDSLDDTIAKGFGYSNLEELKDSVRRQLINQKEQENKMHLEGQVIQHLLKNSEFATPRKLIDKRFQELKHETEQYLQNSHMPEEEINKKMEGLNDKLKAQAEEQVRVFLILDEIAKFESIERDDNMPKRVIEFLFQSAQWS